MAINVDSIDSSRKMDSKMALEVFPPGPVAFVGESLIPCPTNRLHFITILILGWAATWRRGFVNYFLGVPPVVLQLPFCLGKHKEL